MVQHGKEERVMARIPVFRCNENCTGCKAMFLSKEQYARILADMYGGTPRDVAMAHQYANTDVTVIYCLQRQQIITVKLK